jgi:CheY-like chemotaxis protein
VAAAAARKEDLLRAIVDALGGTRLLALECDVSSWTVRAWLTGKHSPSPGNRRRIAMVARDFGLPSPYGEWAAEEPLGRPSATPSTARDVLSELLDWAYGSADGAQAAIDRALRRAKQAEVPASAPEILTFVRSGLLPVLAEDLGPRRTVTLLDEFIAKHEARSGIREKDPESSATPSSGVAVAPRGSAQTHLLRVLLVDADPVGRSVLARELRRESCHVTAVGSLDELGPVVRSDADLDVAVFDDRHPARILIMEAVVERFPAVSLVVRSAGEAATRTLLGALGVTQFEVLSCHASSDALVDAILKVAAGAR